MEENEEIQHMTIKDLLSMLNLSPYVSTSAEKWLEQMALELLRICQDDIIHMMSQLDSTSHYSIGLKMMDILQENLWLGELVLKEPGRTLPLLDRALLLAQKSLKKNNSLAANLSLKKHGHIRIDG